MFSKAHCIGSPTYIWSEELLSPPLSLLSLLIEPLTGYARILSHSEDQTEMNLCKNRGFIIAETLPYSDDSSRWKCRSVLSQTLKIRRAHLEWVSAVEDLPNQNKGDYIRIPIDGGEDPHQIKKELKKALISHRYLCATLDGD